MNTPPTGTPASAKGTWSDAPPMLSAGRTRLRKSRAMRRPAARARGRVWVAEYTARTAFGEPTMSRFRYAPIARRSARPSERT